MLKGILRVDGQREEWMTEGMVNVGERERWGVQDASWLLIVPHVTAFQSPIQLDSKNFEVHDLIASFAVVEMSFLRSVQICTGVIGAPFEGSRTLFSAFFMYGIACSSSTTLATILGAYRRNKDASLRAENSNWYRCFVTSRGSPPQWN